MSKLIIKKSQDDVIKQIIQTGINEGLTDSEARGMVLEAHIRKGWEGTGAEIIGDLTVDQLGRVLFGDYEVEKQKYSLQEFEVTYRLNKFTTVTNKVVRNDEYELSKEQVIESSIRILNRSKHNFELKETDVVEFEVIKKEL